jgi:flagellin-like hook-associated protein FlgL
MSSGKYTLEILSQAGAADVSYKITKDGDMSFGPGGVLQVNNANLSGIAPAQLGDLVNASGAVIGINIGSKMSDLAVGQKMSFEYIAKNEAKVALEDYSGQAQQIAQDANGTQTGSVGYAAAGAVYNSGRGVRIQMAAFNSMSNTVDSAQNFTYERANSYSVNLSNTNRAGAYLTTVSSALDRVTNAFSDLGSLMSRLSYKEEQSAIAQVNVEGAYSRIMNANMAEEQMSAAKYSILQQTATSMLAQANAAPQTLLTLFK